MTETPNDAIARMQAVMEPVSKHLNGLHAEEFDESCIECDRYRLSVELAELDTTNRKLAEHLGASAAELEQTRIDRDERLTLAESSYLTKLVDELRASRDRLLTACDLVEDNFLTTPDIRAFFAEAVSDRG